MSKEIYISSTPHETRLAIVENDELTEIYYERENEYTLAGSIYNGRVTRVLPGMQSSFVDIGLERDAFLYITDFMEEAGDSADFEQTRDTPRPPRTLEGQRSDAPRGDGSRGDGGRGDRGQRDRNGEGPEREQGYLSERSREQAAATPASDAAIASEGRDEESGRNGNRNDRGGRGRGRGRRDRGGSGDRSASAIRPGGEARAGAGEFGGPEFAGAGTVNGTPVDEERFAPGTGSPDTGSPESLLDEEVLLGAPGELPEGLAESGAGAAGGEVGEGAPGADGSRRWRGRRGRRRGRGLRDGTGQVAGADLSLDPAAADATPVNDVDTPSETSTFEEEGSVEPQGRESFGVEEQTDRGTPSQPVILREGRGEEGLSERLDERSERSDGRDRGARSSGRGERNDRGGRIQVPARVPRGFAPRTSLYGVDSTPEREQVLPGIEASGIEASGQKVSGHQISGAPVEAQPEPLILPGESLGKYRKGGETQAASAATSFGTPVALPDSGFKVDPHWDGSAVLPGETLSRYRGGAAPASAQGPRSSQRSDLRRPEGRPEGRREGRGERGGNGREREVRDARFGSRPDHTASAEERHEVRTVPDAVPAPDLQSPGPISGYAHMGAEVAEIQAHQAEFTHAELPQPTAEAPQREDLSHASHAGFEPQGAIHQIDAAQHGPSSAVDGRTTESEPRNQDASGQEYEPTEASASYRVDRAAPSEYRQSAPVVLEQESAPPAAEQPYTPESLRFSQVPAAESTPVVIEESYFASSAAFDGTASDSHTGSALAAQASEATQSHPLLRDSVASPDLPHTEGETTGHGELTTIAPTGEMVSAPQHAAAERIEDEEPVGAPVAGTAIHPGGMVGSLDAVGSALLEEEAVSESGHAEFSPGAGDLEEDYLEEDEFEGGSLHARAYEEVDDLEEEEQIEAAPDLGMMIRDMSLDHITQSSGPLDEESDEDFEEDTLEEEAETFGEYRDDSSGSGGEMVAGEPTPGTRMPSEATSAAVNGYDGPANAPDRGDAGGSNGGRRSRRDNGRRGGRGDRFRSGNREAADRPPVAERGYTPEQGSSFESIERSRDDRGTSSERPNLERSGTERSGADRSGTERSGTERSGADRSGNDRGSSDRYGSDRYGSERARNTGGSGDRDRHRSGGNGRSGRQTMQATNLPAISELLKPGQELLCQIAKEPIAKKGARITSHIALPGRFLVFMPTVSHIGVSRKIESDGERRRLKEILLSEKGEAAGGFIVRTAAAGAGEEELRSDLRFLLNLWADIKQRSESSKSPALIYHDLNLVERILRDQVTDSFSAIWVDTETEYERVLRFLQRFQPGLIRRVKLYTKETPLFEQFGITEEINKALRSKVWLKSGGSIVINQTEALVAIDINTGKFVGKTARLEDTIVKTNLDAIPEIVRQIRLRDLGGIIIIDFIDMDDRRNRNRVMAALEDELKSDRAPSKVLPFNDFGLVAITRKRVKQSLERTLSTTCNVCIGTGMVKSPITVCNDIYIEMRKMHKHLDRGDVMLRVHPEVVKQLKQTGSRWLQEMEEICGKTILIKSDPSLHPEQFDIH